MKKSTYFLILFVLIILVGGFQLTSYASQTEKPTIIKFDEPARSNYLDESQQKNFLEGNWKVKYNSEEMKGAISYVIKKEGDVFNAFTTEYFDEDGQSMKADGEKTLIVKSFNGKSGVGTYKFEYEGKQYDVLCKIHKIDDNSFKLSYEFYGYSGSEIWKRI